MFRLNEDSEYFLIDSEDLGKVRSSFYGYAVVEQGLVGTSAINQQIRNQLDGNGCYIDVFADAGEIRIQQDYVGCFGLYLYRRNARWVLSNSFWTLAEYLKKRLPITFNRDYAYHLIALPLCSHSIVETPISEVSVVDKDVVVIINVASRSIDFVKNGNGKICDVDSFEGMGILDSWFLRWTKLIRGAAACNGHVSVDLSGGFDSRMTLLLALKSGIDLSRVAVRSRVEKVHTHCEDFEIASQIAKKFDLQVNQSIDGQCLAFSVPAIVRMMLHNKVGFHKGYYYDYVLQARQKTECVITGAGGECIRDYWNVCWDDVVRQDSKSVQAFYKISRKWILQSLRKILSDSACVIMEKYHIQNKDDKEIPNLIDLNGGNRAHFGRFILDGMRRKEFMLSPLLDPCLSRLSLTSCECKDRNLLMAVIFVRYAPELLQFKFQGGRTISEDTIALAKHISGKYTMPAQTFDADFHFDVEKSDAVLQDDFVDAAVSAADVDEYFRCEYLSDDFRRRVCETFGAEVYDNGLSMMRNSNYCSLRQCKCIWGLMKIVDLVRQNHRGLPATVFKEYGVELRRRDETYLPDVFYPLKYSLLELCRTAKRAVKRMKRI